MKRRLIRVVGVMSLLMLAGTVWMWGRSYWFDDQVQRTEVGMISNSEGKFNVDRLLWIGSSRGRLAVMTVQTIWFPTQRDDRAVIRWWWSEDETALSSVERRYRNWKRLLGFGFGSSKMGMPVSGGASPATVTRSSRCVIMPWGIIAAVWTIVPIWWAYLAVRERRKEQRLIRGLCGHCGYDLRGAGGVCPECGKGKAREMPAT